MEARLRRLTEEATKYATVGTVATVVSLVVFNALVHGVFTDPGPMHEHPVPAYVLGSVLGMTISYLGSRLWTFGHRQVVGPVAGVPAFVLLNVATMAIPVACLSFSRYVLGLDDPVSDNVAANVVGLGLGAGTRFWVLRQYIFLHPETVARRSETSAPRPASGRETR